MRNPRKELETIINMLVGYKRTRILSALRLDRAKRKPKVSYGNFRLAALTSLKKDARRRFKKSVRFLKRFTFPKNLSPRKKIHRLKYRLYKLSNESRIKRLIYIYWGYKGKKRICIYVGKTKGKGPRAAEHDDFFKRYDVTTIKLYRVKKGKRYLDATECYGIHAYAPSGKKYPPENERRGDRRRKKGYYRCRICKYVSRGWRRARILLK